MQRRAHPAAHVPWLTPDTHPATWTDLAALPVGGRVIAAEGHVAIVCDERPGFWFGNCIALRDAPAAGDGPRLVAAWHSVFDARPAVVRMIFEWETADAPDGQAAPGVAPRDVPDLGMPATVERSVVLRLDAVGPAPDGPAPWPCRAVETDAEFAAVADAMVAALATDPAYADFVRWKAGAMRDVVRAGGGTWWAAWDGGVVAAALGVVGSHTSGARPPDGSSVAGLQEVVTRPTHRRRGACAHLGHAALRAFFERSPGGRAIVVADPDGDAIRVYRRLGFRPVGTSWAWGRSSLSTSSLVPPPE